MAALNDFWVKKETIEKVLKTMEQRGMKGISFTAAIDDKTNEYGQNVSVYVSQSKEEREDKKDRFYFGNGKVFWTDGKITKAEKKDPTLPPSPATQDAPIRRNDNLPF